MTYLTNVKLNGEAVRIGIEDGKIASVESPGPTKPDSAGEALTDGCGADGYIDCGGADAYPGLIDIHIHGCIGYDTMDEEDHLREMSDFLIKNGVTTWYPTTVTMAREDIVRAASRKTGYHGSAEIAGFHMEGPHINPLFCGAMNERYITRPDPTILEECPEIKLVTIAPELPGSKDYIKNCPATVSLGHTDADYDTAMGAFRTGARCLTHAFNAMRGIHHRDPGPLVAAVDYKDAFVQLIADGIHIHPSVLRTYISAVGTDRVILISDSMRAAGLSDGEYILGGKKITVTGGKALTDEGKLAGSTVTLLDCVKNMISFGYSKEDAVRMASENPARLMGLNKGKISVGYDADIILTDGDFNLIRVIKSGIC